MMAAYTVVTGEGGELAAGLTSESEARRAAQSHADRLGKTVYLSGPGIEMGDDDEDIGEAVEPSKAAYRITATYQRDGQTLDSNQAEVLGEAYGRTYPTEAEALEVARRMQREVGEYGLHPTTRYYVEAAE